MNATKIEWTDFSANPIKYRDAQGKIVWACAKVSEGCKHCYSERIAHQYQRGGPFSLQQIQKVTPYFCDKEARKILRSTELAGKRVFIGDMTDVFGEWVSFEILDKLFAMFALRPDVTFQVLTKRPERMNAYFADRNWGDVIASLRDEDSKDYFIGSFTAQYSLDDVFAGTREGATGYFEPPVREKRRFPQAWPFANVWLGTSVENQKMADERIPRLLACPAAVRFLSVEPLLSAISLRDDWILPTFAADDPRYAEPGGRGIDWAIVGGESGGGASPMHPDWVRSLRDQCGAAGVPFFFKQWGAWAPVNQPHKQQTIQPLAKNERWMNLNGGQGFHGDDVWRMRSVGKTAAGRLLDGKEYNEMPPGPRAQHPSAHGADAQR